MNNRKVIITGIRGQDGAYLAKLLLEKGYDVFGADRRSGDATGWRLRELGIENDVNVLFMDLLEDSNIYKEINKIQPDEFYNLAAQSFVGVSFEQPFLTSNVNAMGVLRILETLRTYSPHTRFYQASSSEMFGKVREPIQTEQTPFHPRSPYGVSKVFAHWMTVNYREAHDMYACSGILFNHESPLRGEEFVTRKITRAVAKIRRGEQEKVTLGNLNASRDWGFAQEYVEGMWQMLQQAEPDDFVLASGKTHSVREFCDHAFQAVDLKLEWRGEGVSETGIDQNGVVRVEVSPTFYRPAEVDKLVGNAQKARDQLGWTPEVSFERLVQLMVDADLRRLSQSRPEHIS